MLSIISRMIFIVILINSFNTMAATVHVDCGQYNDKGVVIYINNDRIGTCPIGAVVDKSDVVISTNMTFNDERVLTGYKKLVLASNAIKNVTLPLRLIETLKSKAYKIINNKSVRTSDVEKLLVIYWETTDLEFKKSIVVEARNILNKSKTDFNEDIIKLNSLTLKKWYQHVVPHMYKAMDLIEAFHHYNTFIAQINKTNERIGYWEAQNKKYIKIRQMMDDVKLSTKQQLMFLNDLSSTIGFNAIVQPMKQ